MLRDLSRLTEREFDLLVVGGGVHGLAAAYDAAQRGLSVALVESGDFGSGASFNHLKTVHGGLRYLQNADLKRMRESIVERRTLARIAPHLLTPLPFLMPTYRSSPAAAWRCVSRSSADALVGRDRNAGVLPRLQIPMGRTMSRDECLRLFPAPARSDLTGGALWYDYQMRNTDRLTLAFGLAAAREGACLANYVRATTPLKSGGRVTGMRVRDGLSGETFDVRATHHAERRGGRRRPRDGGIRRPAVLPADQGHQPGDAAPDDRPGPRVVHRQRPHAVRRPLAGTRDGGHLPLGKRVPTGRPRRVRARARGRSSPRSTRRSRTCSWQRTTCRWCTVG